MFAKIKLFFSELCKIFLKIYLKKFFLLLKAFTFAGSIGKAIFHIENKIIV